MKLYRYFALSLLFVVMITLQGCGDETSGTLTMADLTIEDMGSGISKITSTATYSPSDGKSPLGVEITFNYSAIGSTTRVPTLVNSSITSKLGSSGTADFLLTVDQVGEDQLLQVTASFGGLSVTKIDTIPALPSL